MDALSALRTDVWLDQNIAGLPGSGADSRIDRPDGLRLDILIWWCRAAALQQAVELIRGVTESGGSVADAVARLEEELQTGQVETVPLEPGQRDVVRVMNLHQAKGLEAPVVFLVDPLRGVKARADVRIRRNGSTVTGYIQLTKPFGSYGHTILGEPADWTRLEQEELAYLSQPKKTDCFTSLVRAQRSCSSSVGGVSREGKVRGHGFDSNQHSCKLRRFFTASGIYRHRAAFGVDRSRSDCSSARSRQAAHRDQKAIMADQYGHILDPSRRSSASLCSRKGSR